MPTISDRPDPLDDDRGAEQRRRYPSHLLWSFVAGALLTGLGSLASFVARSLVTTWAEAYSFWTIEHDLLLLGFVPLSFTALGLMLLARRGRLTNFVQEASLTAGAIYFVVVGLIALAHALLYPSWSLSAVDNVVLGAAGAAGLMPVVLQLLSHKPFAPQQASSELDSVSTRSLIDASCRQVVLTWYISGTFWLVAGSVLALLASIKMHAPYFLADAHWLTFGRVRPAHLNTMIYGWGSMAAIGTALWLQGRLARVRLPYRELLLVSAIYWNAVVAVGTVQILSGDSSSVEWLEFPSLPAIALTLVFVVLFLTSLRMLVARRNEHIYVSQWYLFGAVFWFPFLYLAATMAIFLAPVAGISKSVANWWFAHNVLGLWLTPTGLATAYYLIPKILGRPVHSYYLSLVGFWSLALFYNWAGTHHLIGGPVPAWLVTLGIVGSIMMFVPVITVAINHHMTMVGHFSLLRTSPSLRFVVFGAMAYTLVSLQGSLMALRSLNQTTHFTHYTIAHAHLGVYAFFTMIMFGGIYYIVPRVSGREWWSARLIRIHFWTCAIGVSLYFVALTWAGVWQGRMMGNPDITHLAVVRYTVPYLVVRSAAGILMTVGHLSFAFLLFKTLRGPGIARVRPERPTPAGSTARQAVMP